MAPLLTDKPINIAIIAMGGQGGGVLSKWILNLAESQGYIAQYTSVPGVAQRTGATIYYIELFPAHLAESTGKDPILALTPVPGDVDIVIASEMIEAGRALMRGFVSDNTSFIASNHRDYAIFEKQELGDGRKPVDDINRLAKETARDFICFDMDAAARSVGSVISSVLFGALAGSGALPFKRSDFEATISASEKAVQANLKGFELGFEAATSKRTAQTSTDQAPEPKLRHAPAVEKLLARMESDFPPHAHFYIREGLKKLVDFQGIKYANFYLDRLAKVNSADKQARGSDRKWQLTKECARYLALAMAYDDMVRVADLKTRSDRFDRFREEVKAEQNQIVHVSEFMHPRLEEIAEILPVRLGNFLLSSKVVRKVSTLVLSKGRRVSTTKLGGFLLLYMMGRFGWMRKHSLRLSRENLRIDNWLAAVTTAAQTNYALAVELTALQRLIKGYGDTHERGLERYSVIMDVYQTVKDNTDAADTIAALKTAALKDEEGIAFAEALEAISIEQRNSNTIPLRPLTTTRPAH